MPIKKDTKTQVKTKLEGMMFHCMDLTNFMEDHLNDPYFKTERGNRIKRMIIVMCANHATALMEFMFDERGNEDGDNEVADIGQMLNDLLL